MLSSVLNSERAIQANIVIMRTFVKLKELEIRIEKHDEEIKSIFEAIRQLMKPPEKPPKRQIGFYRY